MAFGLPSWASNPLAGVLRHTPTTTGGITWTAAQDGVTLHFPPSDQPSTITFLLPEEARDWTKFQTFLFKFRSDSTIRWQIVLRNTKGENTTFRVQPYQDVRTTAAVPIRFLTTDFLNNRAFKAYALANWGNHIDSTCLESMTITMAPNRDVTLELGGLTLTNEQIADSAELPTPVVDQFGQWKPGEYHSVEELRAAWKREDEALKKSQAESASFGGWKKLQRKATGFFRVEQVDGRWWFIDPEGYAFWSAGMDCVRMQDPTPVKGREALFDKIPPHDGDTTDFYEANLRLRYGAGDNLFSRWRAANELRLRDWGFNTVANWSDPRWTESARMPYVTNVSLSRRGRWEGFPDIYADEYAAQTEAAAKAQCTRLAKDPYLIGYFIGNEPHWQNRGLVDRILRDSEPSASQRFVRSFLEKEGDTPASRDKLLETLARRYFQTQVNAIRKADPNHLVLGIRWAGNAPDPVLRANDAFDVFSINIYRFEPPSAQIRRIYELVKRPILIGEFHFGAAERGYAPSLVMVKNQEERGVAYRHYVEAAAAEPAMIGAHYFQFLDQPVTGRYDGENYNLGFVTQLDMPYAPMVDSAKRTHSRMYEIHAGKLPPTTDAAKVR